MSVGGIEKPITITRVAEFNALTALPQMLAREPVNTFLQVGGTGKTCDYQTDSAGACAPTRL